MKKIILFASLIYVIQALLPQVIFSQNSYDNDFCKELNRNNIKKY